MKQKREILFPKRRSRSWRRKRKGLTLFSIFKNTLNNSINYSCKIIKYLKIPIVVQTCLQGPPNNPQSGNLGCIETDQMVIGMVQQVDPALFFNKKPSASTLRLFSISHLNLLSLSPSLSIQGSSPLAPLSQCSTTIEPAQIMLMLI